MWLEISRRYKSPLNLSYKLSIENYSIVPTRRNCYYSTFLPIEQVLVKYGWDGNRLKGDDCGVNCSFSSSNMKSLQVHKVQISNFDATITRHVIEHPLCLTLPFHGRDGNRLITLANALRRAKYNHSKVALSVPWSKWYRSWLDERDDVILDYNGNCSEVLSSNYLYYLYSYQEHNPMLRELIPSKKIRDAAEAIFVTPFISVHRRQHETCGKKNYHTFCVGGEYKMACNYDERSIRKIVGNLTVVLFSDNQNAALDNTFSIRDKNRFQVQMWAMTLSRKHYGNPLSSDDYIISHWRKDAPEPASCFAQVQSQTIHRHIVMAVSSSLVNFSTNLLESYRKNVREHVNIHLVTLSPQICQFYSNFSSSMHINCEASTDAEQDNSDEVVYQHASYLKNTRKKLDAYAMILTRIPDNDIALFVDADVVFLGDPFSYQLPSQFEWWFSNGDAGDSCFRSRTINSGLFFVKATNSSRKVFNSAKTALSKGLSYDKGDQGAINHVMKSTRIPYGMLPCDLFANGNIAFGTKRLKKPVAIHANWITNSRIKENCLLASGLWLPSSYDRVHPIKAVVKDGQVLSCKRDVIKGE